MTTLLYVEPDEELSLQALTFAQSLGEVRAVSVRFDYKIRRGETLLVEGSTRLACVTDSHGLKRLTDEIIEVLKTPERAQSA